MSDGKPDSIPNEAGSRPFDKDVAKVEIDLRESGLLWFINRSLLHPRGYALGLEEDGTHVLFGDGQEVMSFDIGPREDEMFQRIKALLE